MPRDSSQDFGALQDQTVQASGLLKVLANETRLQILCDLLDGEKPVGELEAHLGLRQSALSQHLAVLRRERLVKTRRNAQFIYYSLASEEARTILETLFSLYCAPAKQPRR